MKSEGTDSDDFNRAGEGASVAASLVKKQPGPEQSHVLPDTTLRPLFVPLCVARPLLQGKAVCFEMRCLPPCPSPFPPGGCRDPPSAASAVGRGGAVTGASTSAQSLSAH